MLSHDWSRDGGAPQHHDELDGILEKDPSEDRAAGEGEDDWRHCPSLFVRQLRVTCAGDHVLEERGAEGEEEGDGNAVRPHHMPLTSFVQVLRQCTQAPCGEEERDQKVKERSQVSHELSP